MKIEKICLGFNRNRKKFAVSFFSSFAVIWTLIEAITSLLITDSSFDLSSKRIIFILFLVVLSVCFGLWSVYPPAEVVLRMGSRNTRLIIHFGNLFDEKGIIVIPASQYFESEIEEYISPKSLQAQFIERYYHGNRLKYKNDIKTILKDAIFTEEERGMGLERRYILGESPVLSIGVQKFIHLAITETEIKKFEPRINASIDTLVFALRKLWQKIISESNGESVVMPLLGSGITGVGLPPQRILELNLIVMQEALSSNHTLPEVRIVLHYPSVFSEIDLTKIN